MKSSMTSIRVIYVHREREKVDFKSREVNCLKECALALMLILYCVTIHMFLGVRFLQNLYIVWSNDYFSLLHLCI